MSIKIRRLRNSDPILISAAFREMGWNKPESQYQKYCQLQEKGKIIVLVAEWNNDFAGYLKISWKSGYPFFQENNIPEIQDLNVIQKHRRKGVATNLMDEAEALICQNCLIVGIGVGLHPGYNAAQRLYVQRGYVPDANGITWQGEYIKEGQQLVADDDLILYLTKRFPN